MRRSPCYGCGYYHSEYETCGNGHGFNNSSSYTQKYMKLTQATWQATNNPSLSVVVDEPKKTQPKEDEDLQWLHDEVDRFVKAGEL